MEQIAHRFAESHKTAREIAELEQGIGDLRDVAALVRAFDGGLARAGRGLVVAAIYIATLNALDVPLYKAMTIGAIALAGVTLPLDSRAIQGIALALLAYTLACWIGAVPEPTELHRLAGGLR